MASLCAGSSTPLKSQSCASNLAILHAKNWRQPRTPVSDCVRLACWGSLGHTKINTKINRYGLLMEHLWNLTTWHWTIMKSHSFPSPTVSCAFSQTINAVNPMNPAPGVHTLHSPPLPSSPRSRESIWPITSNRKYRSWLAKSCRDACRDARSWKGTSANLGNSLTLTMHYTSLSNGFKKRIHRSEESFFTVNQFSKHLSNKRHGQKTPACSCSKTLSTACLNFSRSDFRGRGVGFVDMAQVTKGALGTKASGSASKEYARLACSPCMLLDLYVIIGFRFTTLLHLLLIWTWIRWQDQGSIGHQPLPTTPSPSGLLAHILSWSALKWPISQLTKWTPV